LLGKSKVVSRRCKALQQEKTKQKGEEVGFQIAKFGGEGGQEVRESKLSTKCLI